MNILITGGAGFIGSHTTERIVQGGHSVRVIDNFSTGRVTNLSQVEDSIDLLELDIRDYSALLGACQGIDVIVHLAAVSSVELSINKPQLTNEINTVGTLNVIEAARQQGVRRVIYASSAAVYGNHPELPKTEGSPTRPLSPYAWHKLSGEFYGVSYQKNYGLEFLSLRYFNVYGSRQDPASPYSGVISIFIDRSSRNQPLTINGDGMQTRDFIQVSDVAQINLLALQVPAPLPGIINVATGIETSILGLAKMIVEAADSESRLEYGHQRQGDIQRSYASVELMVKTFGYKPPTSIRDGIEELL